MFDKILNTPLVPSRHKYLVDTNSSKESVHFSAGDRWIEVW